MNVEDWSWAGGPNSIVLVEATGEIIARVLPPTDGSEDGQHARARLIAAAPELAEALVELVRRWDAWKAKTGNVEDHQVFSQAKAALEKAGLR